MGHRNTRLGKHHFCLINSVRLKYHLPDTTNVTHAVIWIPNYFGALKLFSYTLLEEQSMEWGVWLAKRSRGSLKKGTKHFLVLINFLINFQAVELAMKFVSDRAYDVARIACPRLAEIKCYEQVCQQTLHQLTISYLFSVFFCLFVLRKMMPYQRCFKSKSCPPYCSKTIFFCVCLFVFLLGWRAVSWS